MGVRYSVRSAICRRVGILSVLFGGCVALCALRIYRHQRAFFHLTCKARFISEGRRWRRICGMGDSRYHTCRIFGFATAALAFAKACGLCFFGQNPVLCRRAYLYFSISCVFSGIIFNIFNYVNILYIFMCYNRWVKL